MVQIATTELTLTKSRGVFLCPGCRQQRPYRLRGIRKFLTLYFVPVLPLGEVSEHVWCEVCRDQFPTRVLQGGAVAASSRRLGSRSVAQGVILAAMRLILADGRTTSHELVETQRLIRDRTGIRATLDEIEGLRGLVAGPDSPRTAELLERTSLGPVDAERAVRDLFLVAAADSDLRPFQVQEFEEIPERLHIKPARFRRLIHQAVTVTETPAG